MNHVNGGQDAKIGGKGSVMKDRWICSSHFGKFAHGLTQGILKHPTAYSSSGSHSLLLATKMASFRIRHVLENVNFIISDRLIKVSIYTMILDHSAAAQFAQHTPKQLLSKNVTTFCTRIKCNCSLSLIDSTPTYIIGQVSYPMGSCSDS